MARGLRPGRSRSGKSRSREYAEMSQAAEAEPTTTPPKAQRNAVFGWLALITALGLALRLWGITWSLPDARHPIATYHPDEIINLNAARNADLLRGDFDIEFYNYG